MQLLTWKCLEDLASAEWPYSCLNCNLNNNVTQCIPGWQYCHHDETVTTHCVCKHSGFANFMYALPFKIVYLHVQVV